MSNARNLANLLGTSTTVPSSKMITGSIIQTAYNNFCSADTTSGTSLTNTGLSVNITPLFQSSVFIVNTSQNFYVTEEPGTDAQGQFVVQRTISGTDTKIKEVVVGDHTGNGTRSTTWDEINFIVYDIPNTTSQLTYRTQYKVYNTSYTAGVQTSSQCSHITVYEIKQ
mgnify:CR=1 FL=1|tara:strand:- start:1280 stop:1783 length:504 start_codon:yes stop_codon:yes gene_type:complete